MSTERVNCEIKVYDNFIEIIPTNGIKANSVYEFKFKGIQPLGEGQYIGEEMVKVTTEMEPMYCGLMDVSSLLEIVDIPEEIVLYNIREASRYANYIYESTFKGRTLLYNKLPFAVKEFTRYKAAKDCLLKIYMSLITDNVIEGTLGEVNFKLRDQLPDIKDLLDYLDDEIAKWLDAIRGYDLEGRAKMQTAIRGYHHGGRNPYTSIEKKVTPKGVPISMDRGVHR